jgi:hypothetical protein
VSNLDFFETPTGGTRLATPRTPTPARPRRRSVVLIVAFLGVAAALVTALVVLRPHPRDDRPVVLPERLASLPAAETRFQFADGGDWRTQLAKAFGDHPFDGRSFRGVRPGPVMNLVVVRTDSREEADPGLGRAPYTKFGDVSCTHTFQLPGGVVQGQDRPKPFSRDWMLLCWRARETLTVSVLVLASPPGYEQTAARAVDEVWALQK